MKPIGPHQIKTPECNPGDQLPKYWCPRLRRSRGEPSGNLRETDYEERDEKKTRERRSECGSHVDALVFDYADGGPTIVFLQRLPLHAVKIRVCALSSIDDGAASLLLYDGIYVRLLLGATSPGYLFCDAAAPIREHMSRSQFISLLVFGALFALQYVTFGSVFETKPFEGDNLYILQWANSADAADLLSVDPDV